MPALLEDPTSPTIYRSSGQGPYPTPSNPQIPSSIFPRPVTLRDRVTIATLIPFFAHDAVPPRLLAYLSECFNKEIEDGNTYPMMNTLPLDVFGPYWFGNFGAVMILGDIGGIEAASEMERNGADWNKLCLGSFYIKPNYPGRSSHVCNGGFLVTPAARNKGVGKSMGQCYLDWAPQLNYTYSVFNLVYETNTASTKIWDSLGFKRIGRVPGCGNLKSFQEPVDAIIYGRDLKAEEGNVGNEERFDKIRYYLRHSLYPQGADRSEKSRLRSAATHYKLIPAHEGVPEKLMLKDKEVISDPQAQYDIAKQIHLTAHGGINKTTAVIATKYHWVRIKETVSHVIKNCPECKDTNKPPVLRGDGTRARTKTIEGQTIPSDLPPLPTTPIKQEERPPEPEQEPPAHHVQPQHEDIDSLSNGHSIQQTDRIPQQADNMPDRLHHMPRRSMPDHLATNMQSDRMSINIPHESLSEDDFKADHMDDPLDEHISADDYRAIQQQMGIHQDSDLSHHQLVTSDSDMMNYDDMAIDPQIMEQIQAQMDAGQFDQADAFQMPPPPHHGMQHFGDPNARTQLQQQHEIRSDPGPNGQFADPSQMQSLNNHDPRVYSQHQSPTFSQPSSQYISPVQGPHMMSHPVPDDHMMSSQLDDGGGGGVNNMQQIRHVLSMEYMNTGPDGTNQYTQQRQ